jgi:ABC-type Fe3+-hydroxamate transport system substrate-binding protein
MPFTDAIGNAHCAIDVTATGARIVSLVPSLTELLCDLGLAQWLVGRTGFCIHPAAIVANITKIGGTKDVNIEKIRALAPTHLIVNIDENEKGTVAALAQFIAHVIVTHPIAPHDNLELYRLLGGIFGVPARAEALCTRLLQETDTLRTLMGRSNLPARLMLYCIWQDPWMTISHDTYIANMMAQIGWRAWVPAPAAGQALARYPQFDWADASLGQIDGVLLSTEPYRFTERHVEALERQIGKPVFLVDGEMMSWYGSRAIAGCRYLRQLADDF